MTLFKRNMCLTEWTSDALKCGQEDPCLKLRIKAFEKIWDRLKTSCHPPFFIRLIVQLFRDSLLTIVKQRESKPKLICTHICRKCLNAFQKRKNYLSLNKLNKKSLRVQIPINYIG